MGSQFMKYNSKVGFNLMSLFLMGELTGRLHAVTAQEKLENVLSESIWPAICIFAVGMALFNCVVYYLTKQRSLHTRVLGMAVVIVMGTNFFGAIMHYKFNAIEEEMDRTTQHLLPAANSLALAEKHFQRECSIIEKLLLSGEASAEGELQKTAELSKHALVEAVEAFTSLKVEAVRDEDKAMLRRFEELKDLHDQHVQGTRKLISMVKSQSGELARESKAAEDLRVQLKDRFSSYVTQIQKKNETDSTRAFALVLATAKFDLYVSGMLIFMGGFASLIVSKSISDRITAATGKMQGSVEQTTEAASNVSDSSRMLSEGASQQAASIEETSSSLEEMASMTKRNADNAQQAKEIAQQTRETAEVGAKDIVEMTQAMDETKASSNNISKIIKTIDEIAFQTNILALNAAVEAARAGEAGLGFAVVADEVRNLAQRSAQAARETAEKIEDSIAKSERGVEISGKVAQVLQQIVSKAREVDDLVGEIAMASKEQSQGIEQVNMAVSAMDKVIQSNTASAYQQTESAEMLMRQAASLRETAQVLIEVVEGDGSSDPSVTIRQENVATPKETLKPVATPVLKSADSFEKALALPAKTTKPSKPTVASGDFENF